MCSNVVFDFKFKNDIFQSIEYFNHSTDFKINNSKFLYCKRNYNKENFFFIIIISPMVKQFKTVTI